MKELEVTVSGGDYSYHGWIVAIFKKNSGQVRCVVEDANGRLFIHNAKQVGTFEDTLWATRTFFKEKSHE